jgi:mannose-6-phosphate isomerase-like protein (cupin superfamily)
MKNSISNTNNEATLANEIFGKKPRPELKNHIMKTLENLSLEAEFDLKNPPLITKYSDFLAWQQATKHIVPPENLEDEFFHPLRLDKKLWQFVGFVKKQIPEEDHDDMLESFLILEGTCRCKIGDGFYDFKAGDYIEIPLHDHHNLEVTSEKPVKAILQRIIL